MLCACNCGNELDPTDKYGRPHKYIHGHHSKFIKHPNQPKGKDHYNFKTGRYKNASGYIMIKAQGHPRAKAASRYRLPEHDLVMEAKLGRYLKKNELVHHINHIKDDNRIENLSLETRKTHPPIHNKRDPLTGRFM